MSLDHHLLALYPTEVRLVLATANPGRFREIAGAFDAARIDWERVQMIGEVERAYPGVWRVLSDAGVAVPADAAELLRRRAMVAEFQGMRMAERVGTLLGALQAAGIEPILLKGAALAFTVYPSFQDRPMRDVDLLVPPARERDAWEIARAAGWRWDEAAYPQSHYAQHHHLPPLDDGDPNGLRVEVHSALSQRGQPLELDYAAAARVSRPFTRGAVRGLALEPAVSVVHACVHFAWSHEARFGLWRLLRDLGVLAEGGLDWSEVERTAIDGKAATPTYWALELARALGGIPVPEGVLRSLAAPHGRAAHAVYRRHLAMHALGVYQPCPSQWVNRSLWQRAMMAPGAPEPSWPWEIEPHPLAPMPFGRRVSMHLTSLPRWWRYLQRLLATT